MFVQSDLYMPQLSSRQASLFAAIIFAATIALTFLLPGYTITLSGFLIVVFLSVFVESRLATIIAGIASSFVVTIIMVWNRQQMDLTEIWTEFLFILILILFTALIVLYIKGLIRNMQFDKSQMTSLFENATEGIILTNNTGTIILANPAALKMFEYEEQQLIGKPIEILLPKKYRAGHVQLRDQFYAHPGNRTMGSGRDLYGQKSNGENFPVEVSLSSYKQQNIQYVIGFIVDITHRKEIEQSMLTQQMQLEKITNDVRRMNSELEAKVEERTIILKEALQRLEQSQEELSEALDKERQLNEIKSRFVSMASHEFRTPLSGVLSSASLLSKYTTSEQQPNRDKHINRIKESVKHLNDLLEDFLSLGKLDEGKIGANISYFNLKEVLQDTIEDLKGIVKQGQNIHINHIGSETILSDKNMMKNIVINLISNAIKFSNAESNIFVHSRVNDEEATISVKDEGMGIPDEDQQHLFSSFFRGKNAINIQGTGLGLHIVKRYVDLLGGELHVESKLGKGTTITLNLPLSNNINNGEDYFSN
jgi:PAS domain S-box-containing protein